ncbi:CtsR family transcriptional regulator [Acetohalobium arabaticum]|uniref:Transcriptional regulator CtsR n=1 Tax=Acetohalobium arabaticum (strain ATCC 49924 / DSM 5501 / Z-7288) TaxID=574087 RepID=D9QSZ1_ACEAZ|nr:CtsR family transcriptional regulator [Acetohalobium arabaticum]ADL11679.1 transcriptional repressor, CtsR [Acetohalobium arabaticum DSM 5501]
MSSLSDRIEYYLKNLLTETEAKNIIKIQRNKVAEKFNCVPSQINYVLKTRFNMASGYVIESQRGGGGYVKIIKIDHDSKLKILKLMLNKIGDSISQRDANNIIQRLYEEDIMTKREKELLETMLHRQNLNLNLPDRDILRANMLGSALQVLAKAEETNKEG